MTNIPHDKAHIYANQGASMVTQHKSLPYGTGAGMGWVLVNRISKAQFVMQHQQEFTNQHQQHQPYQPQQHHNCGRGRMTQKQQPQFGANMYHHHQGWSLQTGVKNVEQVNVKRFVTNEGSPPQTLIITTITYIITMTMNRIRKFSTENAATTSPPKWTH